MKLMMSGIAILFLDVLWCILGTINQWKFDWYFDVVIYMLALGVITFFVGLFLRFRS